jgi:flagellar basal body-associated protein FliL
MAMQKILSYLLLLLSSPLLAAVREEPAQSAPVETVSTIYIVIFAVLFVGMIVGFFIYLWMHDKSEDK